jgi:hypothetical protein
LKGKFLEECMALNTKTGNREVEEMSKGENIVKWIKGERIC